MVFRDGISSSLHSQRVIRQHISSCDYLVDSPIVTGQPTFEPCVRSNLSGSILFPWRLGLNFCAPRNVTMLLCSAALLSSFLKNGSFTMKAWLFVQKSVIVTFFCVLFAKWVSSKYVVGPETCWKLHSTTHSAHWDGKFSFWANCSNVLDICPENTRSSCSSTSQFRRDIWC